MSDTDLLISFLGRSPRGENGYRRTVYDFGDGTDEPPLAFFGWALMRRLQPRRLLILGTDGSMWDHLFEGDFDLGSRGEAERTALMEAVDGGRVRQAQLDRMAPLLGERLGCEVRLAVIPYCRDAQEQVELLHLMAAQVGTGERVHLDVTHGFRHLPMIALVAALHLRIVKNAHIQGISYGSYDPDTGRAPVYGLAGLLHIADWLQVLAGFDKDGDYGAFVPLLRAAGLPEEAAQTLAEAAYFEGILNVGEATGRLRKALPALREEALAPQARLLLPAVRERLRWVEEPRQFEKQIGLARQRLSRGDYLRAVLYTFEAVITRLCQMAGEPVSDYDARKRVQKHYEARTKGSGGDGWQAYRLLKNLRNQIAHGSRGDVRSVQRILMSEDELRRELEGLISAVDAGRLPTAGG